MIRSVKLVGSMCLFVFTLFVQAQEIQPKGNQPDSLMNQVTLSASDNDGFYNQYMNNIVPNSPTVSELMKYVDQPVDLFHGLPTIEIPIYTIECGELSLPITLSYHAGGIKVDQIATWVGLGWSLNAGGACTVNCIDDKHGNFESRLIDTMTEKEIEEYMENFGFSNPNQGMLLESWIDNQTIPDICSYNFLGYSGRFFLFNGKAHELYGSKQLIFTNIYPNFAHILSAKDLRGNRYEFGEGTQSTTYTIQHSCENILQHCWEYKSLTSLNIANSSKKGVRTYSLTKVVSPSGNDSICLLYNLQDATYKSVATGVMSAFSKDGPWGDLIIKRGHTTFSASENLNAKKEHLHQSGFPFINNPF